MAKVAPKGNDTGRNNSEEGGSAKGSEGSGQTGSRKSDKTIGQDG